MYWIYKITNKINNKVYIGVTDNIKVRFNNHKTRYLNKKSREYNKSLYRAFRKYGIGNFDFSIIEDNVSYKNAFEKEKYYISKYDSKEKGYNETIGGENPPITSKVTIDEIKYIRQKVFDKSDLNKLYLEFKHKIAKNTFMAICYGKSWRNVCPELIDEEIIKYHKDKIKDKVFKLLQEGAKKVKKPSKKLTKNEVKYIRNLYYEGISITEILKLYPFIHSISTISNIVHYKSWKDVM